MSPGVVESVGNVTPDDMYHGRQRAIPDRRDPRACDRSLRGADKGPVVRSCTLALEFGGVLAPVALAGRDPAGGRGLRGQVLWHGSDGFGGTVPGAEPGQMGARDCATEPVRIVPINPSSQTSTLPFPQVRRYC